MHSIGKAKTVAKQQGVGVAPQRQNLLEWLIDQSHPFSMGCHNTRTSEKSKSFFYVFVVFAIHPIAGLHDCLSEPHCMKKFFRFKRRNPPVLWRAKWLLILTTIGCMEIMPIPVTDSILIYILLFRPLWFKGVVDKLYSHLLPEHN